MLIEDPIDNKPRVNSLQERLALNQFTYKLPTLIQYLKSEFVLAPVAEELGFLKNLKSRRAYFDDEIRLRGILKVNLVNNKLNLSWKN